MNLDLEVQINTTKAGVYTVTYGRKEAPLDVQEAAFAAKGIGMVSPAQLGFLRATQQKGVVTFNSYSRANADVFYDDRDNSQAVIVPDEVISTQTGLCNLVEAHRGNQEYVISQSQRDFIYALVDTMLRNGFAFVAPHGRTDVKISEFGQTELTNRVFTDENLGIKAQDYGDWLQSQGRVVQSFFLDNKAYAKSQKGPYLNRLRVYGPGGDFYVDGGSRYLGGGSGAFGVFFKKTAEGGDAKKQ